MIQHRTDTKYQTSSEKLNIRLKHQGVIYFPPFHLFSEEQVSSLQRLMLELPEEHIQIGDAGEPNEVFVRRVMVDLPGESPKVMPEAACQQIVDILQDRHVLKQLSIISACPPNIRRCQINRMTENSFIGCHLDIDSNPDYKVAIVIQLGQKFNGGEFIVYPPDSEKITICPEYGSVVISRCDYPHEVLRVTDNSRTSLVFFLSDYAGNNRRKVNHTKIG